MKFTQHTGHRAAGRSFGPATPSTPPPPPPQQHRSSKRSCSALGGSGVTRARGLRRAPLLLLAAVALIVSAALALTPRPAEARTTVVWSAALTVGEENIQTLVGCNTASAGMPDCSAALTSDSFRTRNSFANKGKTYVVSALVQSTTSRAIDIIFDQAIPAEWSDTHTLRIGDLLLPFHTGQSADLTNSGDRLIWRWAAETYGSWTIGEQVRVDLAVTPRETLWFSSMVPLRMVWPGGTSYGCNDAADASVTRGLGTAGARCDSPWTTRRFTVSGVTIEIVQIAKSNNSTEVKLSLAPVGGLLPQALIDTGRLEILPYVPPEDLKLTKNDRFTAANASDVVSLALADGHDGASLFTWASTSVGDWDQRTCNNDCFKNPANPTGPRLSGTGTAWGEVTLRLTWSPPAVFPDAAIIPESGNSQPLQVNSEHGPLIAQMRQWRNDPQWVGYKSHTDRWDRALLAFGETVADASLTPMTAAEAQVFADTPWGERWVNVALALEQIEGFRAILELVGNGQGPQPQPPIPEPEPTPPANQAPTVVSAPPDATITGESGTQQVSLAGVFADADGDSLSVSAQSSNQSVVTVAVAADYSSLTLTAQAQGTATITVSAADGNGGSVSDTFTVTVEPTPQPEPEPTPEPTPEPEPTPSTLTGAAARYDANANGKIDVAEYIQALRDHASGKLTDAEWQQVLDAWLISAYG